MNLRVSGDAFVGISIYTCSRCLERVIEKRACVLKVNLILTHKMNRVNENTDIEAKKTDAMGQEWCEAAEGLYLE